MTYENAGLTGTPFRPFAPIIVSINVRRNLIDYHFPRVGHIRLPKGTRMEVKLLNLILAWAWIVMGFLSGLVMGLFFHQEKWLGGYASFQRRMYRLGHISFFGLGVVNLCFFLTVQALSLSGLMMQAAAWCLIAGAITMPVCCLLMAHYPRSVPLFSVPVLSLLMGGVLTTITVARVLKATGL